MRNWPSRWEATEGKRQLILQGFFWLLLVRLLLRVAPVRRLQGWLLRGGVTARAQAIPLRTLRDVGWAVDRAARLVPGAVCLCQALVVQTLLQRRGVSSELRIGVARDASGAFIAHAWVEAEGVTVIGGATDTSFVPLWTMEGDRP